MQSKVLIAGSPPGGNAGGAVGTSTLLKALARFADVALLSHRLSLVPTWHERRNQHGTSIVVATQPLTVHSEALASGFVHRARVQRWQCAWAVLSRHAGIPFAAGIPYVVWEATTIRDELTASSLQDVRRSMRGTGVGYLIHRLTLPLDEALEGAIYRKARFVLAMSAHTQRKIMETHSLGPDRVKFLALPPGPALLAALKDQREAPQPEHPNGRPWRLLFVGRADDPRKNFGLLPAVLKKLHELGKCAQLTVIGSYSEKWRASLSLDRISSSISFAGAVSVKALAKAYLEHDLLLVPSRQEGYGIPVGEAFAAGMPVVSTRCGGPEHMIEASRAGELVPIDPDAMAAAIVRTLDKPDHVAALRQRALEYANGPLSFDFFAEEVRRITLTMTQTSV